jgi:hypothetical protein
MELGKTVMLIGLTDNTHNYKHGKIVNALNKATGRYGVRVFGTTSPIAVKEVNVTSVSESVRTSALVGPFTSESCFYSLSSDSVLHGDETGIANYVDESTTKRLVKECPLGEIFLYNHENLTTVISMLYLERGMKILVEKMLLYGYFENGDETNGYDERVSVELAVFIGGHATIERATMAALQILYANGPRDVDTLGQSVLFYMYRDHTNILITLDFNGRFCELRLFEQKETNEICMVLAATH